MQLASFSNFIAFGNRVSIDLRVIIPSVSPSLIHVFDEIPLMEDSHEFAVKFNETAESLFHSLIGRLMKAGFSGLASEVAEALDSIRFADGVQEEQSCWITELSLLNLRKFPLT